MDGRPQTQAQQQPLCANGSRLTEGLWQGPGKAKESVAVQMPSVAHPSSPMTRWHKCLSRGGLPPGRRWSRDSRPQTRWLAECASTARSARHGHPPTCTRATATRSSLSTACRGELGAGAAHAAAWAAPGAALQAWQPAPLPGPSSPGEVPGRAVRPAAQRGIGDGHSQGKSRDGENGTGETGEHAKLPAPTPAA